MGFPSGNHRFLFGNLLTIDNLTPSEVAPGRVSQVLKDVAVGGAAGQPGGVYTGLSEQQWVVQIDSVAAGTQIGQATFRYSRDGGASWVASGIVTSTSPVTLADGVTFVFTAAVSGNDFATGDQWQFKTLLPYGVDSALDYQDRNRTYRTANSTGAKTLTADLGSAELVNVIGMLDHNFSSGVTATIKGNDSNSFGAPAFSDPIAYAASAMVSFLAGGGSTRRYWQLSLTDAANTSGYLEISTLFLGTYLELPSRKVSHIPWDEAVTPNRITSKSSRGYRRESIESTPKVFPLHFDMLSVAEYDSLAAMRDACWDASVGVKKNQPLIWIPGHSAPSVAYVAYLDDFQITGKFPTGYGGDLTLSGVVRL